MLVLYGMLCTYYVSIFGKYKLQGNFFERHVITFILTLKWKFETLIILHTMLFTEGSRYYLDFESLLKSYAELLEQTAAFVKTEVSSMNNYHAFYPIYIVRDKITKVIKYVKYALTVDSHTSVSIIVNYDKKYKDGWGVEIKVNTSVNSVPTEFTFYPDSSDSLLTEKEKDLYHKLDDMLRRLIYWNCKKIMFEIVDKL